MEEYTLKESQYKYAIYAVLVVVTLLSALIIYWGMMAEQGFDWTVGQLTHSPKQYLISPYENGQTLVTNPVSGHEIILPIDWQTKGTKSMRFELIEEEESICEIKTRVVGRGININVNTLYEENISYYGPKKNNKLTRVQAGLVPALRIQPGSSGNKKEDDKDFIYEWQIPLYFNVVVYALYADEDNTAVCKSEFNKIKSSFVFY